MKRVHSISRFLTLCLLFIVSDLMIGCNSTNSSTDNSEEIASKRNPNSRNDSWGFAGAGGGGAMFNPSVSPYNSDYAFVSCDMTGAYVTYNGGASWRMFNLRSPVHYYVFDPLDSNTVYANSIALFKSTDRGNTWSVLYPSVSEISGVVSKGDHAQERVVTRDSTQRNVVAFAIDPNDSKKLYAAISIDNSLASYVSEDGGQHWTKEKELTDGAKNIYIIPSSPKDNRTVYITGNNSIAVKENDNWEIRKGPSGIKKISEYAGGFDQQKNKFILYALSGKSYFNADNEKSGIYYTEDGGKTWENRQNELVAFSMEGSDLPEWRSIATSATHPEVLYVSYNNLKISTDTTCIGVAKSEDYGITWNLSWKDCLTKKGNIPSRNFKSGWLNERFGPTWGENPFSMGVSPVNPDVCYTTDFGRTVKTVDGGKTWEQVYTSRKQGAGWISRGLEVTTGYGVVFDPFDKNHVFFCTTDIGLMESNDGGESWMSATKNKGIPRAWQNSTYWLAFDPEVKGKAWAVMTGTHDLPRPKMWRKDGISDYKGGVLVTEDGAASWRPVSASIGEAAITDILIDPSSDKSARVLYATAFGKGVYKSIDGGKSWQRKNNGIQEKEPFAWRIMREGKSGMLYLIISRRSEDGSIGNKDDGSLYKSNDGAESWTKISLPAETNGPTSLIVDPSDPDRIVVSAWGRSTRGKFSPDKGGGIFLSKNAGKSWITVLQNDQHIHDITYDPHNNTYYACGFNGSAYRSDDLGETWKRIKGYNFKWGKRVDPDPNDSEKIFITTFGGGVWHGPAEGDENAAEDIITPVLAY